MLIEQPYQVASKINGIIYVEFLIECCRNLLGEDLGPLNTSELEQLEIQLESSLRQIRSTKVII